MNRSSPHSLTPAGLKSSGSAGMQIEALHNRQFMLTPADWLSIGVQLALSPRELELTQHIFAGGKLQAVARSMGLSLGTVKTYARRIYQKLGVQDQRELLLAVFEAHLQSGNAHYDSTRHGEESRP